MTIEEFTKLTGVRPNAAYFVWVIHPEYMKAGDDVDKVTFCKRWKRNGGLYRMFQAMELVHQEIVKEKDTRIDSLEKTVEEKILQVDNYYKTIKAQREKLQQISEILK